MYLIGENKQKFLQITHSSLLFDGNNMWNEIRMVEYGVPMGLATQFNILEDVEVVLQELERNVDKIFFEPFNIFDCNNIENKVEYVRQLKVYELVPTEIEICI